MTEKSVSDPFYVVIVGAGISGINTAYHIQTEFPNKTYTILEGREAIGGTWDLFRYPGIRSDSDLHTFGFPWDPWTENRSIADGDAILKYMRSTAKKHGIDKHIQYKREVTSADWSSDLQLWKIDVIADGKRTQCWARFVIFGTGYYDYTKAMETYIPGLDRFQGKTIHPQFWPKDYDYTDKKIAIIGSGATAITLLPSLAQKASKVTMVQRSPSYIMSVPQPTKEPWSRRWLSPYFYARFNRFLFIILPIIGVAICRYLPGYARNFLQKKAREQLPSNIPFEPHFKPHYNPWQQRLCMCPDGDFFEALHDGKADVATGIIKSVTEHGIELESGQKIDADIIITATGLQLKIIGGIQLSVDGSPISIPSKFLWKYSMVQDVPNAFTIIGYTNASWTLGAEVTANIITRLIKYTSDHGYASATPTLRDSDKMEVKPTLDLKSTYIQNAEAALPRIGSKGPWVGRVNYFVDYWNGSYRSITTGLEFKKLPSS